MQPNSPLGQLNASMSTGQPELNQISSTSPAFQPSLQPPPQPPMPDKSPASLIHRAAARRGINLQGHSQLSQMSPDVQNTLSAVNSQPAQIPVSEAELIIKALTKRLDHHTKVTQKLVDSFFPKPEAPTQQE